MIAFNADIVRFAVLFAVVPMIAQAQNESLVWPTPPDTARIRYVRSVSSEKEVEGERSFLGKVWDFIVGDDGYTHVLAQPVGLTVNSEGVIFVADPAARCVHVLDLENEDYDRITHTDDGTLESPIDVAWSSRDRFFVSDAERALVAAYDSDLDPLFTIRGIFGRPTGLAVYGGKLFVVDTGLHKVFIFDFDGKPVGVFGSRGSDPGLFNFPVFIAGGENLYVTDAMNFRVQELREDGSPVRSIGRQGNRAGEFAHPKGVALDSEGHVYVVDALFDAIQVFDRDGSLLLVVGGSGDQPGMFRNPSGICIDATDRIYVADALNHRIQVFQYLRRKE